MRVDGVITIASQAATGVHFDAPTTLESSSANPVEVLQESIDELTDVVVDIAHKLGVCRRDTTISSQPSPS